MQHETIRVLVAEDHKPSQAVYRALFALKGFELRMVDDGKKALRALTEGDYDAIVMDIAMPEMNGFEAIAEIRKLPGAKGKIPILVVSAHAYAEHRELSLDAGADEFMPKPLRGRELLRILQRLAGRAAPA